MKDKIVTNKEGMPLNGLIHLMSALVRKEKLEGKEHLVIPTVLICEGVHNSLFYPADEIAKFPDAWNNRPVVINHPSKNGVPVSAGDPEIQETQTVGKLFHCNFDPSTRKLKGETWIDIEKCGKISPEILEMLEKEIKIEVSTGLFTETDPVAGIWNNEDYDGIVYNYRPDHLALLPNSKGACSWEDGGGMPRNNERKDEANEMRKNDHERRSLWAKFVEMAGFDTNEISHEGIRDQVVGLLRASNNLLEGEYLFAVSVFDKAVVYELEKKGQEPKLLKQAFSVDASDKISLDGEAVEVKQQISFIPVGNQSDESFQTNKEDKKMRKEQIDALIANEANQWAEDDRELLTNMSDEQFAKVETPVAKVADAEEKAPVANDTEEEGDVAEKKVDEAEKKPVENKALSVDEYINNAPAEMRETLKRAVERDKTLKANMVKELTANKRCKFSKEQLASKSLDELQNLMELANIEHDFSGASPASTLVENEDEDVAPAMPAMKWNEKGRPDFSHIEG